MRGFTGQDAFALFGRIIEGYCPDSCFRQVFDLLLCFGGAIPVCHYESPFVLNDITELIPAVSSICVFGSEINCFPVNIFMDLLHQSGNVCDHVVTTDGFLGEGITPRYFDSTVFSVARTNGEPYRYTLKLIICEFEPRFLSITVIVFY